MIDERAVENPIDAKKLFTKVNATLAREKEGLKIERFPSGNVKVTRKTKFFTKSNPRTNFCNLAKSVPAIPTP
jgi:hypothetical protein